MANLAEREGQATMDLADPALNPTQMRKTLSTGAAMEEAAKEKIDGGGRQPGLGHRVNS